MGFAKKTVIALLCAMAVVGFYSVVEINLFNLDNAKKLRELLFSRFANSRSNESIVILNTGTLSKDEVEVKVDSLIKCYPRKIGINLCHLNEDLSEFKKHFEKKKWVVVADCKAEDDLPLSRILNSDNTVTHFKTDRKNYFEFKIESFEQRDTPEELIYFTNAKLNFYHYELSNVALLKEYFQGKTVLIGYVGDYLTDTLQYFDQSRITPMNEDYGLEETVPDMYDTEISACIVQTLQSNSRLVEISTTVRILVILFTCFISVMLITLLKTKWIVANVVIAFIIFILLNMAATYSIVHLFTEGFYLSIDELPLALAVVVIFTVSLNVMETKSSRQK